MVNVYVVGQNRNFWFETYAIDLLVGNDLCKLVFCFVPCIAYLYRVEPLRWKFLNNISVIAIYLTNSTDEGKFRRFYVTKLIIVIINVDKVVSLTKLLVPKLF